MRKNKKYLTNDKGKFQSDQYEFLKPNEFVINMETIEGRAAIKTFIYHIMAYGGDQRLADRLNKNIKIFENQLLT